MAKSNTSVAWRNVLGILFIAIVLLPSLLSSGRFVHVGEHVYLEKVFILGDVVGELEWMAIQYRLHGSDVYGRENTSIPVEYNVSDGSLLSSIVQPSIVCRVSNLYALVYCLTGNETYLKWAEEALASFYNRAVNKTTFIAEAYNVTSDTVKESFVNTLFVDQVQMIGVYTLIHTLTGNSTYLKWAQRFADAVYNYCLNKSTWLTYYSVYPDGSIPRGGDWCATWTIGPLARALSELYMVSGNKTYVEWAEEMLVNYYNYARDPETGLLADGVNSSGRKNVNPWSNRSLYGHTGLFLSGVSITYLANNNSTLREIMASLVETYQEHAWNNTMGRYYNIDVNGRKRNDWLWWTHIIEGLLGHLTSTLIVGNVEHLKKIIKQYDTVHKYLRAVINNKIVYITDTLTTNNEKYTSSYGMTPFTAHVNPYSILYVFLGNEEYLNWLLGVFGNMKYFFRNEEVAPYGYVGRIYYAEPHYNLSDRELVSSISKTLFLEYTRGTPMFIAAAILNRTHFKRIGPVWVYLKTYTFNLEQYISFTKLSGKVLNITINSLNKGLVEVVVDPGDYGEPEQVSISGRLYDNPARNIDEYISSRENCWYYSQERNLLYIKVCANSSILMSISWREY